MGYDATVWESVPASARTMILEHFGRLPAPGYSEPVPYFSGWPKPSFTEEKTFPVPGMGDVSLGAVEGEKAVRWYVADAPCYFLPPMPE